MYTSISKYLHAANVFEKTRLRDVLPRIMFSESRVGRRYIHMIYYTMLGELFLISN